MFDTEVVETAVLAQVVPIGSDVAEAADSLQELARLADTAGIKPCARITQRRKRPDGGFFFGDGKVKELAEILEETHAPIVIFDNPLNAIQAHNLGQRLRVRVMDRTELILEIFSRHARTKEAQTQVELARTEFKLSRIPELAEQQRFSGTGGGMRVRGPGESHLQLRNQPIRRRIADLRKQLEAIRRHADQQREQRRAWPNICLCGYTNAGKSTLLSALTHAEAYCDDRLFATLDTQTRLLYLSHTRKVLLTDTVGFIRNLPHTLVASFRSTLADVVHADLLLLVVDASHPRVGDHIRVSLETLRDIGADHVPRLIVFNKADAGVQPLAAREYTDAIAISAKTGQGLDTLKEKILNTLLQHPDVWHLP